MALYGSVFQLNNISDPEESKTLRKMAFLEALSWVEEEGTSKFVGGSQNRVVCMVARYFLDRRLKRSIRTRHIH